MKCPPPVARGLRRVSVGMLAVLAVVAGAGWLLARQQLGATPADTRARVEAELRDHLKTLGQALDAAVAPFAADGATVEAASGGAGDAVGALFELISARSAAGANAAVAALTVYGAEGTPLGWEGRPASLPLSRVTGPAATFLVSTPLGLRLARLEPILQAAGGRRRVGAVVAEAALSMAGVAPGVSASPVTIEGRLAPVLFGPVEPHGGDASAFDVPTADGRLLATARVSARAVDEARAHWRSRVTGALWAVLAAWLALLWGPLSDWREAARTRRPFVVLTLATSGAGVAAWLCAGRALAAAGVPDVPSYRLLLTALLAVCLASLALGTAERWRAARRGAAGLAGRRHAALARFIASVLAGAGVGVLAAGHDRIVDAVVAGAAMDAARVAITAFDPARLSSAAALLLLQAAAVLVVLIAVATLLHALAGHARRRFRGRRALLTAAAAVAAAWWTSPESSTFWTALPIVAMGLAAGAWWDRARRVLRHGSQPARLLVLFIALALPSISAYPSLAAHAALGQQEAIEHDLAQQVANQRVNLQLFLREALTEIDAAADLPDLVAAAERVAVGQVPADAAFHVWSQTSLSSRRLTSSVELYDTSGQVASRFALNLPETAADQAWQETSCSWELFEEVSPFFAEERRLLHAGREVCVDGRPVGAVVVHVVLDYANLPFLTAQNPYVGLMHATAAGGEGPDQGDVAFVVYGWSRRPLFVSGGDAWPISPMLFTRIAASRTPFWATIEDRGVASDVFLQNDRGGIYAIGYPRTSLLAHLATVAELVTLAALTFGVLLVAVTLASLVGARAPVSGRALLREVRASFYRTLFLAFVAAVVVPVVALALVTRAYMATSLDQDIEREATRTVLSASRVVEDFATIESRGATNLPALDDSLLVWLSRVIGEDINIFAGTGLLASSE